MQKAQLSFFPGWILGTIIELILISVVGTASMQKTNRISIAVGEQRETGARGRSHREVVVELGVGPSLVAWQVIPTHR